MSNVDAPKGGLFSTIPTSRLNNQSFYTFNSLNAFILKGEGACGMELTFATLMARAGDEPDAMYGQVAKSVQISPDKLTYRFTLRPEARFHDGTKLTAHDAAFSLTTLKEKGHPLVVMQMRDMVKAEALDDATLVVTFAEKRARDVPLYVATLPIFSKAYYATRPFDESTLDIPLGSGPYKVGRFEANRYIEYDRVKDWWGADLARQPRSFQFRYRASRVLPRPRRRLRGIYRQELSVPRGIHLADLGDALRLSRHQGRPRQARGRCPTNSPAGAQGWFMNTRRKQFKDPRVREAVICAFDFEWTNKTVMYGAYARTISPFQNSDMVATGLPSPEELKLLEPFRGKVPDEVFGEPFVPPVSDGSGQDRTLLRKASQLLTDAGLVVKDGKRLLPDGDVFKIEFLLDEPSFQPHHAPFLKNLGTLGIEATLRLVDAVQYPRPRRGFRFRHDHRAALDLGDAGRFDASDLLLAGRRHQRFLQSGRDRRSRHRCADRKDSGRRYPRRADDRLSRLRPGIPRRPLLGAALVPRHPSRWPIGICSIIPKTLPRYQIENYVTSVGERILWWYDAAKAAKLEQAK